MTDPAIIAASYAAEINYTHNLGDVIDVSEVILAIGTEKVDTTTLKDRSLNGNDATIHGAMPAEGFIQGRRFAVANSNYLDFISSPAFSIGTIEVIIKPATTGRNPIIAEGYNFIIFREGKVKVFNTSSYFLEGNTDVTANTIHHIKYTFDGTTSKLYLDGALEDESNGSFTLAANSITFATYSNVYANSILYFASISDTVNGENSFNTLARLPFWSVNYTDYPDNVTEYTDNLPYSSSIISSGTFKVDDDKLQCVSAGTMTYSASYEFDGSEYIKVEIGGVEYAGTGTITQGNTTVSVAQGSNKITITMGTGDTIEGEIGIQFREEA